MATAKELLQTALKLGEAADRRAVYLSLRIMKLRRSVVGAMVTLERGKTGEAVESLRELLRADDAQMAEDEADERQHGLGFHGD